jgi:hypothetical protein
VVVSSSPLEPQAVNPAAIRARKIAKATTFVVPVNIAGRSAITRRTLLKTAAALHGEPGIAREVRVGPRALAE